MKTPKKHFFNLVLLLILLSACTPKMSKESLDEVTVQLKWVHQAQFAGIYLAQELGYYAEENLLVTIVEGGPGIDDFDEVASGKAQFGINSPIEVISQPDSSQPVVAIAAIFQQSPVVFVSLADSKIKVPVDLLGKKISTEGNVDMSISIHAIFDQLNLELNQDELVPHTYDLTPLIEGEVDVIGLYSTGGLIRLSQDGHDLNLIWPSDYGHHMYSDILTTSTEMIQTNPDLVTRFLRATLRGWRQAAGDVDLAVPNIMIYAENSDLDTQTKMLNASVPLIHTGVHKIGWMENEVWTSMYLALLDQGILSEPVDISQFYSLQFLIALYGDD